MLRKCGRCGEEKPVQDFNWRRKWLGQLDNYCRPCRAAYKQEHYSANKKRYLAQAADRKRRVAAENVALLFEYFNTHPCVDCGEADPLVLEFDHLRDKSFGIARGMRDRNWSDIVEEIEKCEVVCANCHRRRTATRGRWARATAVAALKVTKPQ